MTNYICQTCGTQFAETREPPAHCPICEDDRQYVGWDGQKWTTEAELKERHRNVFRLLEPGLTGIGTEPGFAIGQRALLVQTPAGNVLWDCLSLIDAATLAAIHSLGGVTAIAISHPHFYASMVEWSHALAVPIYLHRADQEWVMRPDSSIHFWDGDSLALFGGLSLVRCGGHFDGSTILHWPAGAEGRGALLTGDTLQVTSDRRWVSFMYSYPNYIPLSPREVQHIVTAVQSLSYDRIYGAWWERVVPSQAQQTVERSAQRYIAAITDPL